MILILPHKARYHHTCMSMHMYAYMLRIICPKTFSAQLLDGESVTHFSEVEHLLTEGVYLA